MLATITIAIRPTPNHPSCRSTTVPPARPTCRVESVIALSTTRPHVPPSSGQSTFWRRRRSMPIIGSPANLRHRHLLEEDRVEDPSCDGRGGKGGQVAAPIARRILNAIFFEKVAVAEIRDGRRDLAALTVVRWARR